MIDSHYPIPQNPEENEAISANIRQTNNFWRWFTYLILLSLGGGVSYSWYFFTQQLIPSIEQSVSDYISRPVKLGKIEAISLNKIRLGESRIETTDTENDFVITEGVEISLNPLQLLANQQVNIGIKILNLQGFLQQNKDDSWIKLNLNNDQNFSFFGRYFHVSEIILNNGFINIKSNKNQDIYTKVNVDLGNVLIDKNQVFFDVKASINNQEKITLNGLHLFEKNNWLLKINTKDLAINNINKFIELPLDIDSGDFTGDLVLNFVQDNLDNLEANLDFKEVNLTLPNLPNSFKKSQGNVKIDNENISLKNIETNFALIPLKMSGKLDNNLNLNLQVLSKKPVEINQILSSLNIQKENLLTKGKIAGELQITGNINKPKIATKVVSVGETQIDKVTFNKIAAYLALDISSEELVINNLELQPTIGGKVTGNGKVNLGKKDDSFSLTLKGIDIEGKKVATLYQQSLPMKIGLINGDYQLRGNWGDLSESRLTGNAVLELETGKATINNLEINPDIWRGEVRVSGVRLTDLPNLDCEKFGCDDSLLNAEFLVMAKAGGVTPENINLTGEAYFDLAGGRVALTDTSLHKGRWQTKMTLDNLSLSQLPSFNLSSSILENGKLKAQLQVGGGLNNYDEITLQGKANLFLPQGDIDIDNFTLKNDSFMAQTHINNFSLADFGDDFRGEATGEITWRGDINNLTANNLNLEGNLIFSQGINIISQPLITEFAWHGETLEVKKVRFDRAVPFHDKVYGRGIISYDKETEALTQIDLEIIGKGIELQTLPLPDTLDIVNYQGNIDLQGRLTGDISKSQPNLTGKINLNNFQLTNIEFSPLTGNFNTSLEEGMNIKLESLTTEEKLYIDIDKENQPQKIEIQNNNSRIEVVRENQTLAVTANHLPLDKITKTWLTYLPNDIKNIGGDFSGEIKVNLIDNNFIASNIIIEKPRVNNFQGDTLTTQLISGGDVIKIEEGKIHHQENEYLFSGELISLGNNPQVKGKLEIKEGDIQNFLRSLEIFELKDFSTLNQPRQYGKAKDLYSFSSSSPSDKEKKSTSGVASSPSDLEKKLTTSVVSSSPSDLEKKTTTSVVSSSFDNLGEKLTTSVASSPPNNLEEKLTTAVVSSSPNHLGEKTTTSGVSSSSDNLGEKLTTSVASSSPNHLEKKLTTSGVSSSSDNLEEKTTTSVTSSPSDLEKKTTTSVASSPSDLEKKTTTAVVSSSPNHLGEKLTTTVASSSPCDNLEKKLTTTVASSSPCDNLEKKTTTSGVSSSSDNLGEKLTTTVASSSPNHLGEKTTTAVVSSSPNHLGEKTTTAVASSSPNNLEKKLTTSGVSSSSDNLEEKLTTSGVSSSSDNLGEKATTTVVSSSPNNLEKKLTTSGVSSSSDNLEEKLTTTVASSSPNHLEKKLTTSGVSSSSDNLEEKLTTAVVSSSPNHLGEKTTTSVVSSSSDNLGENTNPPIVSNSDNKLKPVASIESDEDSLLQTLELFRQVNSELKQQELNRINGSLPRLEDLEGRFRGNLNFSFSFNNGFQAEFDFRGDDWQWGKYHLNFVQATGSFADGLLTLLPIQIQQNNSILSLTGTYSKERIAGDIRLSNLSIYQLKQVLNFPSNFNIEGTINANIAVSGSEEKPLAKGNIEVIDSKINSTQIQENSASFGFRNSRLDFLASSNLTENNQPLTIIGSFPFQLFTNSIIPENNDFQLSLNLAKEGFNLLSIVTNNELNWLSGNGNINLDISGKYYQLTNQLTNIETQGIATFENGIIDGKILANKSITDINGEVLFDFSQLTIPNLTGNFSGGNISISGSLPIVDSRFSNDFLTISVDDLALDIDNFYQGNAQAMVSITGSSIEPIIGGKIKLYNGEIEVSNKINGEEKIINNRGIISQVKINDLELKLGNNVNIIQAPLLNLKAEGSLKLNGNLSGLKPDGIINFTGGNLNLFTSQFNLARGNNIAKFSPENGFNPYLDIHLESRVTETNRYKLTNNSNPNEIQDFTNYSVNTAQTVRIKANVRGWSDNLANNIDLSSSPQRSQTEIIALLGGGFFDNFTEADGNLGLANLASAALLGSVQGQLQQSFGFNQLRLFPTQILDTENRTSSLAFGAELGLDITDDFSFSITKILTNEQAPQYNVIYRLNDKTILRGSSDFDRDSRGVVEFEHRF